MKKQKPNNRNNVAPKNASHKPREGVKNFGNRVVFGHSFYKILIVISVPVLLFILTGCIRDTIITNQSCEEESSCTAAPVYHPTEVVPHKG